MAVNERTYRGFRVTRGDATGEQLAILVPTDYRVLHVASAADEGTDWNVANPTHPTAYIHSETTPATDYIAVSHDGTDGYINSVGGTLRLNGVTSLYLSIGGTNEVTLTATALSPTTSDGNALGTTALMWGDLFLASGGVINFNNGNATITHAAAVLTLAGADIRIANGVGLSVGYEGQVAAGAVTSEVQVHGTAPADSTMLLAAWSADAVPPRLYFAKSRSATIGTFGIITTGDNLGEILAFGDDGVDFNSNANASAAIIFDSAGTIAADRVPGVIRFQTATDADPSVLTTALTIDSAQLVTAAAGVTITATGLRVTAGGVVLGTGANRLGLGAAEAVTIATGVATVTKPYVALSGEGAADDQLDTITFTGAAAGDILILTWGANTITVDDANIDLGAATRVLSAVGHYLVLVYDGAGWGELSYIQGDNTT